MLSARIALKRTAARYCGGRAGRLTSFDAPTAEAASSSSARRSFSARGSELGDEGRGGSRKEGAGGGSRRLSTVSADAVTDSAASSGRDDGAAEGPTSGGECPFGFSAAKQHHPELNRTRTLPFFGSMISAYSGTPTFDPTDLYEYHAEMRRRFGDWYSFGIPGFGQGAHGTMHVTIDPDEFMKVVRSEGSYPSGIVENVWVIRETMRRSGMAIVTEGDGAETDYGLFGRGERWKRQRTFLQTGMLDPRAARGFVPGISAAARLASRGAPSMAGKVNEYLNLCAFDMFNSFMLGEMTRTADSSAAAEDNEENARFCKACVSYMDLSAVVGRSPYEIAMSKLGILTSQMGEAMKQWSIITEIGNGKFRRFLERRERGELNEMERASYFAKAMHRFEAQSSADDEGYVSKDEVLAMCLIALFVGVDTTSTVTSWNLLHLAMNPRVQEKLHAEVSAAVAADGNDGITAKVLERSNTPYLNAVLRETNRLTPPFPQSTVKTTSHREVEVHGTTFPVGTVFALDNIGNDARYVGSDAQEFRPERWSAEEVETRKGTKASAIDHALNRDPFGTGARRCPGSRVATNEVLCMIARLVLDYEIRAPKEVTSMEDVQHESMPFITPKIPTLEFVPRQ